MTEPLHDRVVAAVQQQYELEQEIGRGGMSVVYRARDLRLNRQVALKVLPPELAYDTGVRTRFTREAQTAAQLGHPHIVPIYDVGERDGIAWLTMALVSGGNLASLLAQEPRQPVAEVKRLLAEIADALHYAHQRGVIHRDIKPDNILLDRDSGRAMVTDFGIARAMEAGTRLTATGNAVGTPAYMSPEQAVGERELDGRSDIYSLGVLGYQMLTGRPPFTAANSMALLMKHVTEKPRPIAELRPEAPRPLREAIERALQKEPEERWPTAGALREALTAGEASPAAWRPEPREPVRYPSPRPAARPARPSAPAPAPAPVPPSPPAIVMEPAYAAQLNEEQRADLRLWNGRLSLPERIWAQRWYGWYTAGMWCLSFGGLALAIEEGVVPLVLGPLVPAMMTRRWWRRLRSLRASGVKIRRLLLMPLARWVLPARPRTRVPTEAQLVKLAPREILEGVHGAAIRRAAEDRAAILDIVGSLSKQDRAMISDVTPTANALVERVAHLAQAVERLDQSFDPRLAQELDGRIADAAKDSATPDGERRMALLRRQRATLEELVQRRAALAAQMDSAGLALRNLRLDLIKLRSSGLQASLSDVTSATREARALSSEIGTLLDAAAEVRSL